MTELTRTFTVAELEELDVGPWSALANIEGEAHRWYTIRHLVFDHEGRFWQVQYMDPASEIQEGQDCWTSDDSDKDATVEAIEVRKAMVVTEQWVTAASAKPEDDPFVDWVIGRIIDDFHEMCDGGAPGSKDAPFGSYARPTSEGNVLTIRPNDQADDWDGSCSDPDEPWVIPFEVDPEKGYPLTPAVRITVERIA